MKNYTSLDFKYDSDALLHVLDPLKTSITSCNKCDNQSKLKIYKLLGIALPIATILYFQLKPSSNGFIHMDKNLSNPNAFNTSFALNIPLYNGKNVLMRWYHDTTPDEKADVFTGPSGTDTPLLSKNRAACIDELYYTKPHLVNIDDWHSVENHSDTEGAQFISLRFYSTIESVLNYFGPG